MAPIATNRRRPSRESLRRRKEARVMQILKQAWWTPLAGVLVLAQVWVGLAFLYGEGTSNLLDAEGTTAGVSLAFGGGGALAMGLWVRTTARGIGDLLIIVGAVLGAIWVWTIVMTPLAIVVIGGVIVSQRTRDARDHARKESGGFEPDA